MKVDFLSLNDDELLKILTLGMTEAVRRGGAVRLAAQKTVLSAKESMDIEARVAREYAIKQAEQERLRVAAEARRKLEQEANANAAADVSAIWAYKAAVAVALERWGFTEDFELNIWSRGADRRVYFQGVIGGETWKYCLYITGNPYKTPGYFEIEGTKPAFFVDKKIKPFLCEVAEGWKGDVKIDQESKNVAPNSLHLARYLKVIGLEEDVKALPGC